MHKLKLKTKYIKKDIIFLLNRYIMFKIKTEYRLIQISNNYVIIHVGVNLDLWLCIILLYLLFSI